MVSTAGTFVEIMVAAGFGHREHLEADIFSEMTLVINK